MKKLIVILSLLLSFSALAQQASEPAWRVKLRSLITQVAGSDWSNKLLGDLPALPQPEVTLPEIPQVIKKSTDIESYRRKTKGPTEFDKLPLERRRQFDFKFIEELFLVTRKTDAKEEDLSNWLNTLDQGGSREGIYQALVLDEVYNGLESIEGKPTKKLLDFCLKFSQTYLKQTFKADSLKQLNLYSLKRIFTDKGMDILDYYEVKDLDALYQWYALVSAEMARHYSPFLQSEIRKNDSAKFHFSWAQNMPIQHVKSEFIIKMHVIMNGLQLLYQE